MDLETIADILTESHKHLAETKSCGLTCTLISQALQTEKCWDELKGIHWLKFCNANIHTHISCFMEIQQKDNKTLTTFVHHFKATAKWCAFENNTVAIHIFVKAFQDAHIITAKIYEMDPQTFSEVIRKAE